MVFLVRLLTAETLGIVRVPLRHVPTFTRSSREIEPQSFSESALTGDNLHHHLILSPISFIANRASAFPFASITGWWVCFVFRKNLKFWNTS